MSDLPSPITHAARSGARSGDVASSPALDAIRRRRARPGLTLLATTVWRAALVLVGLVVTEADLALDRLDRHGLDAFRVSDTEERVRLVLTAVALVTGLAYVLVPLLRLARSRALAVPPARSFRGIPGPGAALAALWWIPLLWSIGLESRSNNTGPDGWWWLDVAAFAALAAGRLAPRAAAVLTLDEGGVGYRGPDAWLTRGAIPEEDVVAFNWNAWMMRIAFGLVGIAIWLMAFTVGGSIGAAVVAAVYLVVQLVRARSRVEERWAWRHVRIVALDGASPAIQLADVGVLELGPLLQDTSANERAVWTIAEQAHRATGGRETQQSAVDQMRTSLREHVASAKRTTPTGPVTIRPRSVHAVRGRFAAAGSVLLGVVILAIFGWRAASGDIGAIVIFTSVVTILAIVLAWVLIRSATLRIDADATSIQLRGLVRRQQVAVDRAGAIVGVPVFRPTAPAEGRVDVDGVVVDREGGFLLRLRGADWTPEQLEQLAEATGLPVLAFEQVLPITTLAGTFPGYAPVWERDPAKVGIAAAVLLIGGITAGVFAFGDYDTGSDDYKPDPRYEAERQARRDLRDSLDELVQATFPFSESEGGRPTGCIDPAAVAKSLTACRVAPSIRTIAAAAGAGDADDTAAAICRCEPGRYVYASASGMRDPEAEPGSLEELEPTAATPRIVVEADITDQDGTRRLELDATLVAGTDARTITDIRCLDGPTAGRPFTESVAAEATPAASLAALRCPIHEA